MVDEREAFTAADFTCAPGSVVAGDATAAVAPCWFDPVAVLPVTVLPVTAEVALDDELAGPWSTRLCRISPRCNPTSDPFAPCELADAVSLT